MGITNFRTISTQKPHLIITQVQWEAPIIKPELTEAEVLAGSSYRWDEETLEWILETPEPLT